MVAVSTVSPSETMSYNSRRAAADQNLLNTKATNAYQRALQSLQYADNVNDFERAANRARIQLPTSYLRNNTFNSGLYRNALSQYAVDRLAGLRNLQRGYQIGEGNLIFADRAAEDSYATQLSDIAAQQYARQAEIAAMLRNLL